MKALLAEHLVLMLPGQNLNEAELVAFARLFGAPHEMLDQDRRRHPTHKALGLLASPVAGTDLHNYADMWHSDGSHEESPESVSMFQMVKTSPRGGDTLWSNQYAAFQALSGPMQALARTLTGVHHHHGTKYIEGIRPDHEHPIVPVHPVTGRDFLYVTNGYLSHIPQLRKTESRMVLDYLRAISVQPEFTIRRSHSPGDIVVWDNWATMHYGAHDFDPMEGRLVWRVGVDTGAPMLSAHPEGLGPHFDQSRAQARLV